MSTAFGSGVTAGRVGMPAVFRVDLRDSVGNSLGLWSGNIAGEAASATPVVACIIGLPTPVWHTERWMLSLPGPFIGGQRNTGGRIWAVQDKHCTARTMGPAKVRPLMGQRRVAGRHNQLPEQRVLGRVGVAAGRVRRTLLR